MAETAYLISRGNYSDYEVYAVFTDEAAARARVRELNAPYWRAWNYANNEGNRGGLGEDESNYPYSVEERPLNTINQAEPYYKVSVYADDGEVYSATIVSPHSEYYRSLHAEELGMMRRGGAKTLQRYIRFIAVGATPEEASRRAWEKRNRYLAAYPQARFVFPAREINKTDGVWDELVRIKAFFEEQPNG